MSLSRRNAGLVVFLVALVLRLAYVHQQHDVLGLDVSQLTQTDNYVFAQWARTIAEGDVLCRHQPHAYHHWTRLVAPEDRWLEWYGGELTFHQAPLYPYFVGLVYAVTGFDNLFVGYAQALIGALTCLLTFVLASRLLSIRAGLLAGGMLAFMGSYYFYDAFILRDGPMAFVVILSTLALDVAVERGRARDWLLAGASLGLFTLAKETGLPLLALTLLAVGVTLRRQPRRAAGIAALLLAGWLVVSAPAYARNAIVGAPTFKLSTRGPEVFITGNAQGQSGVGWSPPIDLLRELLMESNFSLPRAMALTLATHRAQPTGFLDVVWNKTEAYLNSYEVPNNVNFYLHRSHLSTVKAGFVSMAFVSPAMLVGLLLGIQRRRRLAVLYLMLGSVSASVILLYILARFRLQALPLMTIFAALTLEWMLDAWKARRSATLCTVLALLLAFGTWSWSDNDPYRDDNKNTSVMLQLAKTGNFRKSLEFRDKLIAVLARDRPGQDPNTAEKLLLIQEAFDLFEQGTSEPEGSATRHHALADGYARLIPITKRADLREFSELARQHYLRALELDDARVGVRHGMGMLEASVENHFENSSEHKNFGVAYRWFAREVERTPDHGPSLRDLGRLHLLWEQYPRALEFLLEAEAVGTADPESLAAIARISIDAGMQAAPELEVAGRRVAPYDPERAETYARRALAEAPDQPNVMSYASDVFYLRGEYEDAIKLLEGLRVLQPWREGELAARIEIFRDVAASAELDVEPSPEGPDAGAAESDVEEGQEPDVDPDKVEEEDVGDDEDGS